MNFNVGNTAELKVLKKLQIKPGALKPINHERLMRDNCTHAQQQEKKEHGKGKWIKRKREEDKEASNNTNNVYSAGLFYRSNLLNLKCPFLKTLNFKIRCIFCSKLQ